MSDKDQEIRERAHRIWEQAGQPEGQDADHWYQAVREVLEGGDAEAAKGGQSDTELTQTDQAEATAADAASDVQEGLDAEGAAERLSEGDELSTTPPASRPAKRK